MTIFGNFRKIFFAGCIKQISEHSKIVITQWTLIDNLTYSAKHKTFFSYKYVYVRNRVSIVPELFQFSSSRTFGLLQFRDHGTTGPSGSLGAVLSSPGTQDLLSRDFPGRPRTYLEGYLRKKINSKIYVFLFLQGFFW